MFGKTRTLVVAIAAAGLIGSWAPMASAATAQGPGGGNFGGLLNVSNNNIPIQACNDQIPVNVLGVQVPLNDVTAALGLISEGDTVSNHDSSCHQASSQDNGRRHGVRGCRNCGPREFGREGTEAIGARRLPGGLGDGPGWGRHHRHGGNFGGLINLSNNNIPIQLCNDQIPVNVLGIQVPLNEVPIALGLLNGGDTRTNTDSSCHQGSAQRN